MAKVKKVLKHVHAMKYSVKDSYCEQNFNAALRAEFYINKEKRQVFCRLIDDRLELLFLSFINRSSFENDCGDEIYIPTYHNPEALLDYFSLFCDKEDNFVITAVSKCHPEDDFDEDRGKSFALAKVLDKRDKICNHFLISLIQE